MRQWLFRGFAFAVGAGLVWALWAVLVVAVFVLAGGVIICDSDADPCGGPANDFFDWSQPVTDIAIPVTCLGGGALLAAKRWNR